MLSFSCAEFFNATSTDSDERQTELLSRLVVFTEFIKVVLALLVSFSHITTFVIQHLLGIRDSVCAADVMQNNIEQMDVMKEFMLDCAEQKSDRRHECVSCELVQCFLL